MHDNYNSFNSLIIFIEASSYTLEIELQKQIVKMFLSSWNLHFSGKIIAANKTGQ